MLTKMEKGGEYWDESGPKKGGKMLVMGKTPCPVDHDDLLMDTEVSGSQEIRDDLRRLVR